MTASEARELWRLTCLVAALIVGLVAALFMSRAARAAEHLNREFQECPECPKMVAVPAGKFVMGSPATEHGRFDNEGPQHVVTVRAFAIGLYDVTNAEFKTFLQETGYEPPPCNPILGLAWKPRGVTPASPPDQVESPRQPAVCLNWNDAQAYIAWLNSKVRGTDGRSRAGPYRLPSEAEWEYAARATTTTAHWWGDAIGVGHANCNGCGSQWDGKLIAPVGTFGPNPFGLYDVLGNVWQWVDDCWNESYVGAPDDGRAWTTGDCSKRVLRGGSWSSVPAFIRSATRIGANAAGKDFDYSTYAGFRVARTLP